MGKRASQLLPIPIALWVLFFCLAIVLLVSAPFVGTCLLDRDSAEWLIELHRFILKISLTGVVFTVISAILFPFVFFGLKLLGSSISTKILDYALASMFGCAFAVGLCATYSQYEVSRHPTSSYATTFQRVKDSAEESARNSSYGNVVWGQLRDLQNKGAMLVCAEYFVDHICNFVAPGILLPPMFLYIWKRRKNR